MNYSSEIATNSYTTLIEVEGVPHLPISLVKIQISVEVTGRGPTAEYIATINKTYHHQIVKANYRQKLFILKKSKDSGQYYFTWKIRIDNVKRKHLKNSNWCYNCNFTIPCEIERIVKLKARDWRTVEKNIVRLLDTAKGRNPSMSIHWTDWGL